MLKRLFKAKPKHNPNQLHCLPFATAESVHVNSEAIWNDKSPTCANFILPLRLSETLVQDSTISEKDSEPWWTDASAVISSNLSSPIGIDSVDSASSSCNTWWNTTVANSWFSTKLFTHPPKSSRPICSTFCTSSVAECTDSAVTVPKSRKIKVLPNREQRRMLKFWLAGKRYVFNATLKALCKHQKSPHWKSVKTKVLKSMPRRYKAVPQQIKADAVREAWQALRNAKLKAKQTGEWHEVSFQHRHMLQQSMFIPASAIRDEGVYTTMLGSLEVTEPLPARTARRFGQPTDSPRDPEKRYAGEPKPTDEVRDSRLTYDRGEWFLCVAYHAPQEPPAQVSRIVALDPGVRTFLTFFSEASFGWLGHHDIGRIQRLCTHLDVLIADIAKAPRRKKSSMRRAENKVRRRIQNLVKELHCKLAHFLCTNFDIILLPTFETKQMSERATRKIRKKSVRQMLTFSHYTFQQRLIDKARQLGKQVVLVSESYTSKTCSWTGDVIAKLGGRKVITAPDGTRMDRDLNGARGILVRFLTKCVTLLDGASLASSDVPH